MLHLHTLGVPRLTGPEGEAELLAGHRHELALLAFLARRAPHRVARAELATLLWGDRPEANARQSLRQALLNLKRAVGGALDVKPESVALVGDQWALDAAAFEADLEHGRLRDAVARWEGEFLAGTEEIGTDTYRAWVEEERERLRRALGRAYEQLLTEAERRADWTEAVRWGEQWTAARPVDEPAHRRLIEVLRQAGRLEEALARHGAFVRRLRRELEIEPSADFLRLGRELEQGEQVARAVRAARPSPGAGAVFTPDFVGRHAAFAELSDRWASARAGAASVALVEGDEGIGKTRLCEEFLRSVAGPGPSVLVLRARGYAAGGEVPWAAARALLGALREAAGLPGAPPGALAGAAYLIPGVRERFPTLPPASEVEWLLEDAAAEVLAAVAAETPVLLFIDDLPRVDGESQQLLVALAQRVRSARVLFLLAARTDELEAAARLAPLRGVYGMHRVRLQPLAAPEVEALLGSMLELPADARHELAGRLHAETGGNPSYVVEVVTALVDEGHLAFDAAGIWRLAAVAAGHPLPLPTSVREAVSRRLARLSPGARHVAEAVAVLGGPADPALLQAVTGATAADVEAGLDELITRRLLRSAPQSAGAYEFTHEMSRRVTYGLLAPPRRRELHRAALEVLRARGGGEEIAAAVRYHRARSGPAPFRLLRGSRARAALVALAGLAILAAAAGLVRRLRAPAGVGPVIAVGAIRDYTGSDTPTVARAIPDMLATNLARLRGLQVVSNSRMYELVAQLGATPDSAAALSRAGRDAGATELLEGTLYRQRDGSLRLDLRRVALRTGKIRDAYSVAGADAFALVDSATQVLASAWHVRAPPLRIADVTTGSIVAYRFYEEGLRAYYRGDPRAAYGLFRAAMAEDSAFAMTAYYASRCAERPTTGLDLLDRAVFLAQGASGRERLLIRGRWAELTNDKALIAIADSLVARYPTEPDGHLLLGAGQLWAGDLEAAIPHLLRAVAMDSLGLRGASPRCLACDALSNLVWSYISADSLTAAERTARRWVGLKSSSADAWYHLALVLYIQGRYREALSASRTLDSLRPEAAATNLLPVEIPLVQADFTGADEVTGARIRSGSRELQSDALWQLVVSLRYQGRLRDALAAARRLRRLVAGQDATGLPPPEALMEAQVLFEMGRARTAAALFDSLTEHGGAARARYRTMFLTNAAITPTTAADTARLADLAERVMLGGNYYRFHTWYLTHAATALAAIPDTEQLRTLADTIARLGRQSAYGRDQRLHHYVRGLLDRIRGRPADAVAEFRQAMSAPFFGYTRINLELGRTLLAIGQPSEAISVLRAGVRGPVGTVGLYATKTEFHELLGQAFEAAGQRDSAASHCRWVLNAWKHADPELHARRDAVRRRLARLEGGGSDSAN